MMGNEDGNGGRESRAMDGVSAAPIGTRVIHSRARSAIAAAVLLHLACSRASKPTAPGCCEKSGPGWADDAGLDSAALTVPAPPVRSVPFRIEEGCARDFKPSGDPNRELSELERLCGQGLAPMLAASEITRPSTSAPVEVPFRVTASMACLRAGVVGTVPGQILTLEGPRGVTLASVAAIDSIAVVPADGTVCVREPASYRLVVQPPLAGTEARTLTVQVWQAARD